MSTALSIPSAASTQLHTARPSFVGIVRGELFKISRQITTWIFAVLVLGAICLPYLVESASGRLKEQIATNPSNALYSLLGADMLVLKVFGGAFLIITTARLIGMEYSGGTIRVLLSRGVGRLQLLFGKLTALAIVALGVVIVTLVVDGLLAVISLLFAVGNIDLLTKSATSTFWQDSGTYLLLALLSIGVSILMATALTVVGRSLAFGMSASMLWYPADNFGMIFLNLAYLLTKSDFWRLVSGDLLGPNLNAMAAAILPERAGQAGRVNFATPLVPVDGGHTLLMTGIFAVIFATTAIVLTARRDIKE